MEFHYAARFTRTCGALLALGVAAHGALADETNISFVTASDNGIEIQEPAEPAVGASDLVFADDAAPAPAHIAIQSPAAAPAPSAQGTLSVVANRGGQAPLRPMVEDAAVVPASHRRGQVFTGQGRRGPSVAAPSRQQPHRQTSRGVSPPAPSAPTPPPAPAKGSAAHDGLVRAYELSLSAQSEAEYSQIIRDCADAMRAGVKDENRKFGNELSAWALNRRGQARADQGQFDLALADFRAALEFDPNCWRAYHNRGVSLAQAGQFAEAFDDICRCITINPKFAKAYSNRATLYVQAGDVERAVADYESALSQDPKLTQALVGYGRLCHMTGRLDDALTHFNHAMEQAGDVTAEVACSRGDLLVDLGRYRDALQDYAKAIDLDPQFEHAYRNGAWLLATCPDESVRDANAALAGAKKALQCGYGDRCAALDTLAAAQANAGQYQEAVATISQAIQIAPEEARGAYEERRTMYQAGQPFRTEPVSEVQTADFVEG
ncbi:tetratricopeptide repeat protein [Lacipirellula limnantheis]|uniref:Photosystem I assembly protein Ycf3 n=1 Tax=Lacipirellula limnantheis TaxID=2528024 RepID=A0A517TS64_9BACT|nr:tetratricopeptide repeat protein [Lacipirellula limnantheis]QDT71210.1 photosystem I assembly protein Ycf3 [Lacipirellula limnantheis]